MEDDDFINVSVLFYYVQMLEICLEYLKIYTELIYNNARYLNDNYKHDAFEKDFTTMTNSYFRANSSKIYYRDLEELFLFVAIALIRIQ